MMKYPISLDLITDARAYWSRWFKDKMVPLLVSGEVMDFTCPIGVPDNRLSGQGDSYVVASAEQSFLQLDKEGTLPAGNWMALTPCYRDERVYDDVHLPVFLKLELIRYKTVPELMAEDSAEDLAQSMQEFLFEIRGLPTELMRTPQGFDVMYGDLELGSYGTRKTMTGISYVYGTGLAEPRTSIALLRHNESLKWDFD